MSYPDKISPDFSQRNALSGVDSWLSERWSPRSFVKTDIADNDVETLFDAARWAPSCFNDQPWQFHVSTDTNFDEYLDLLMEGNQAWAKNASLLCFVVVRKQFDQNGKPNPYAEFDAGAAWMALSLQARKMGLYTHGMGGIKHDEVASYLKLDDNHKVICGIAIGVADEPSALPDDIAKREKPSPRKPLADVLIR
ncbi:nitroreductase family protein [Pseudohongiella nitratireducens]|uniref:nitroreductase family protein n=1 Tax=Pseudohongiella nitratireducens TaxID=1768907 RepID=UPI00240A2138|nr:nitroreductase family protein [Pseudohongiella nitratireducens]MDF1622478.1 nitroreductase family protein [Pseudohongiella nitratireducens]|tara:strand:+ start:1492 stop:2076 length:585 start_codon:yes stop_codon:yes gene_type:complete